MSPAHERPGELSYEDVSHKKGTITLYYSKPLDLWISVRWDPYAWALGKTEMESLSKLLEGKDERNQG